MSDIQLAWNQSLAELRIVANDLALDHGLETAVIVSLFTDRRAEDTDVLPLGQRDRRGWWGDAFPNIPDDRIGSRLWLLSREKQMADVLVRAREYAVEALQWLIDDRVASAVGVVTEFTRPGLLGIGVTIERPSLDPATYHFDMIWEAQEARH